MQKEFLEIGRLTKVQGLKGELRMQYYCDGELLDTLDTLYFDRGKTPIGLTASRPLKNDVAVVRLAGVDTPEDAQKLVGRTLYLKKEDVSLGEDEFFIADLIGLSVEDADSGRVYGKVDEIYQNGSTDVYSLRTPTGKQYMFPAIPEVLIETDLNGGRIRIRPLANLFEIYEGDDTTDED
ncbi:MAG: ribosome maturation factor RimM [Bacteroides sp.]|nr:ribosome maturation factor RimM [Eubacterium sp.]MCM1419586.1 ribosome maturation factor RimM [Roseburia sp.]MCM1463539.1 ribosome maturation factor RimM [Bacteroides sp.]